MHEASQPTASTAGRTITLSPPEKPGKVSHAPVPIVVTAEDVASVTLPQAIAAIDDAIADARFYAERPHLAGTGGEMTKLIALMAVRELLLLRAGV